MNYEQLKNFICDVLAPYFYSNQMETPMAPMESVPACISHITAILFQAAAGEERLNGEGFDEYLQDKAYKIGLEWLRDVNMMWVDFIFVYAHHGRGDIEPMLYNFFEYLSEKYPTLECDGFCTVAHHLLSQRRMPFSHQVMAGYVRSDDGRDLYHRWIVYGSKQEPLDFRLKMWFGEGAPEGFVTEESGYEYRPDGVFLTSPAESKLLYDILRMNFVPNPTPGREVVLTNVGTTTISLTNAD